VRRRKCRHDRLRGIYGDEIMGRGWNRSECLDCGRLFPDLPKQRPDWSVCPALDVTSVGVVHCLLPLGHYGGHLLGRRAMRLPTPEEPGDG
jgi:hypothetical protein